MPQFVMIGFDGPEGSARRNEHRDAHVAAISALHAAGRIVWAGPTKSDDGTRSSGAVILFEADDLTAARALVQQDPYVAGGVFERLEVHPVQQVFPPVTD